MLHTSNSRKSSVGIPSERAAANMSMGASPKDTRRRCSQAISAIADGEGKEDEAGTDKSSSKSVFVEEPVKGAVREETDDCGEKTELGVVIFLRFRGLFSDNLMELPIARADCLLSCLCSLSFSSVSSSSSSSSSSILPT